MNHEHLRSAVLDVAVVYPLLAFHYVMLAVLQVSSGVNILIGAAAKQGQNAEQDQNTSQEEKSIQEPLEINQDLQLRPTDMLIAVMGVTGVGKSTLVSLCTKREVHIGHGLGSCTQEVALFSYEYSPETTVYMVDTPGFDDDTRSDSEVLKELAAWLSASYAHGMKLNGIIYLHRITDPRLGGHAKRNLAMFKKLCGPDALSNVILATTMWEQADPDIATAREAELQQRPEFWGYMLEHGSKVVRHANSAESARSLVESFVSKNSSRGGASKPLEIQIDLVDRGLGLEKTGAGIEVDRALSREATKLRQELDDARAEMRVALEERDQAATDQRKQHEADMVLKLTALEQQRDALRESMQAQHQEQWVKLEQSLRTAREENEEIRSALDKANQDMREQSRQAEDRRREAEKRQKEEMDAVKAQMAAASRRAEEAADQLRRRRGEMQSELHSVRYQATDGTNHVVVPLAGNGGGGGAGQTNAAMLVEAAKKGESAAVKAILRNGGVHINDKVAGWTALGRAAQAGNLEVTAILVQNGADLDIRMDIGWGFLPGDGSALNWAACEGHLEVVRYLVGKGARTDIEAKEPAFFGTGGTPVTMAAGKGHLAVVRYLMSCAGVSGMAGWDAMACACRKRRVDVMRCLVRECGVQVRHKGSEGKTLLHHAAEKDATAAMTWLAENGAVVDESDDLGCTPLFYAASRGHKAACEWLVRRNADPRRKNGKGQSPLDVAREECKKSDAKYRKEIERMLS